MLQVRSFAKEEAATKRYGGAQDQVVSWGLRSARASGFFFGFNSVIGTGSIVFVLWYGARQVRFPLMFLSPIRNDLLLDSHPRLILAALWIHEEVSWKCG